MGIRSSDLILAHSTAPRLTEAAAILRKERYTESSHPQPSATPSSVPGRENMGCRTLPEHRTVPTRGAATFHRPSGNLYGTTTTGGAYQVYGTVFKLSQRRIRQQLPEGQLAAIADESGLAIAHPFEVAEHCDHLHRRVGGAYSPAWPCLHQPMRSCACCSLFVGVEHAEDHRQRLRYSHLLNPPRASLPHTQSAASPREITRAKANDRPANRLDRALAVTGNWNAPGARSRDAAVPRNRLQPSQTPRQQFIGHIRG